MAIADNFGNLGAGGFQDLVKSWNNDTGKARQYAERWGYSPNQLANFYNQGNANSTLTGGQAATSLGIDPWNSSQSLGKAWQTMNPATGQFSIDPTSSGNFSGWQPGVSTIPEQQYSTGLPSNEHTPNQVTMPSMSMPGVPNWINDLSRGIPKWFEAYSGLQNLPGQIDKWTNESLKRQRATGDQVSSIFNTINEQRAGSGIMGGTEDSAAKANYLMQLTNAINDNKSNIMDRANTMKSQAISAMPGAAQYPVNAMASLYGTNASDQANWATLAAQLLNGGY